MSGMRAGRSAGLVRALVLVALALTLAFRIGPFCEVAYAAVPAQMTELRDCHAPGQAPQPAKHGKVELKLNCMNPCMGVAAEFRQAVPVAMTGGLQLATFAQPLVGIAAPPEAPPPRFV